ncbi:N-acetylglucosamine-6-phosphate deacetylase [Massilibacteroides sp.]|uniref:N-acetylglucosamine-6-phosphate deacetylase n=1 Tax=Massilibacteroides sp. TaxID=2034766 RepID=UPI00262AF9DA|nr:N-acetylglucosamine-6-phosphate deacetylase [Massilibacteroides sp.]MDD4513967.1 N-acetylglucosamine-6-phosphate deacetylase [Massilibacteroides sp.]
MNRLKIYNGQLITPYRLISNGTVLVDENGVITAVEEGDVQASAEVEIDAAGKFVSPGFIDLHVHGGGGADFMDGNVEAFLQVAKTHATYGTTALVPTTLTSENEDLIETFHIYEEAFVQNREGAHFLGLHLEGPYFSMGQRGAQDPRYIRNPKPEEYTGILERYGHLIARWSAAPELPGAIEFAQCLKEYGILPAIAHTDAVYEDVIKAFENGYTLATHLYSGMSGVTRRNAHRYAGVIESAFLIDEMDVEVIADGIHLPAPFLKLIYKIKGSEHIALVTDAMRGAGMPEGDSILGGLRNGLKVVIEGGVAKLPDRTSFAGSVATTDRLIRSMIQLADVPLLEAVKMLTLNPARIMGIGDKKGTLQKGKDADIILFDNNITIEKTIVEGRVIYSK